jgi:crossover junction endodeoxyribonuclease RuvC
MTVVLGIDPGTATTGYGLVRDREDGRLEALQYGVIQTSPSMLAHQRLSLLFHQLNEILRLHRPDTCAVEKLFFQRNVSTAIAVGQARGVVMLAISEAGLDVAEYTPNAVKQAVAGYGNAGKKQVQEMVRVLLALPELPKPDDAADALAIAITHLHTRRD